MVKIQDRYSHDYPIKLQTKAGSDAVLAGEVFSEVARQRESVSTDAIAAARAEKLSSPDDIFARGMKRFLTAPEYRAFPQRLFEKIHAELVAKVSSGLPIAVERA